MQPDAGIGPSRGPHRLVGPARGEPLRAAGRWRRNAAAALICALLPLQAPPFVPAAQAGPAASREVLTVSDLMDLFSEAHLVALSNLDVSSLRVDSEATDPQVFLPLINYLDLNVLGHGDQLSLDPERIGRFVLEHANDTALRSRLVDAYRQGAFAASAPDGSGAGGRGQTVEIGGYFAGEVEYHQEPDGRHVGLLEINQVRVFVASNINPDALSNQTSVLLEWNPVPEEVVHHPDEVVLRSGAGYDTLRASETAEGDIIAFEQLFCRVNNAARSGIDVTLGQFRVPFGIWSDYTSHRNFSTTKSNIIVSGFALKKIELGILLERHLVPGLGLRIAAVHGRPGRTSNLPRADADNRLDGVGRLAARLGSLELGASAYLSEFSIRRNVAFGADMHLTVGQTSISGEVVRQENKDVNETFQTALPFSEAASTGAYVQIDHPIGRLGRLYGLYEWWQYELGGAAFGDPVLKAFQGFRRDVAPGVRWTVVEYGYISSDFDQSRMHLSSQLEVTF